MGVVAAGRRRRGVPWRGTVRTVAIRGRYFATALWADPRKHRFLLAYFNGDICSAQRSIATSDSQHFSTRAQLQAQDPSNPSSWSGSPARTSTYLRPPPRSCPAPVTGSNFTGPGIRAMALRISSMAPNGSLVPWMNRIVAERKGARYAAIRFAEDAEDMKLTTSQRDDRTLGSSHGVIRPYDCPPANSVGAISQRVGPAASLPDRAPASRAKPPGLAWQ
jgi:hypothetical protein